MNKHLQRTLLTCPWAGIALTVVGVFISMHPLVFIGFGLVFGFVGLVLWSKRRRPSWYAALK